ncbi:MAG TPA: hypothetical protein VG826_00980 [Pirellulales bacterium]|nr:hypothetical protein [Pirellulales bacterium]
MKPDLTDRLIREIDHVIALLTDLPVSEVNVGWDVPRATNWISVFTNLHNSVLSGKQPQSVCYCRGLDFDSICGGQIFDAVGCGMR